MRTMILAIPIALTALATAASADDFVAPAGCISFADAVAAYMLWENPTVRSHFEDATDITPEDQHWIVDDSCFLVEYRREHPGQGAASDFFIFVEESAMYDIWIESGVLDLDSSVSRFGLYAALHELSHGRSIP